MGFLGSPRSLCAFVLLLSAGTLSRCAAEDAVWIAGPYEPPPETDGAAFFSDAPNSVLQRAFVASDKVISQAVWRVVSPGMRDLHVNGVRITSTALSPLTPYRKRILEESFDVTALLRPGEKNVLTAELGNGWWNLTPLSFWYRHNLRNALAQGTPCFRAVLEIVYSDGTLQNIVTDGMWTAGEGSVVRNDIYLGVKEDARRVVLPVVTPARSVLGPPGRILPADDFPKTIVYDRWKAKNVKSLGTGRWLVDMGVNFAGTYRARLRCVPKGETVVFRLGERISEDGTVNTMTAVAGQVKDLERGPLFGVAEQQDKWISDGCSEAFFEPRLTYHVFRYLQVEGLDHAPVPSDFEALAWSADVKDVSAFVCSDAKLNQLHEVCRRTFRANLQSIQSDCPGREKFGYGGDVACTAEAFRLNYGMKEFYRKVVRDFLDEAADTGYFTETAPYVGLGAKSVVPRSQNGGRGAASIGWAMGVPAMLDVLVRYDGDVDIVREAYPALRRYAELVGSRYPDDDIPSCLGDWLAIEKADSSLTALAHWHEFLAKASRFARLLGYADDAQRFAARAELVAAKFRRRHVHGAVVGAGTQGDQLFALRNCLLPSASVEDAYAVLKQNIGDHGFALTTGMFATSYLFEELSSRGDVALAGRIVTHRGYPGYFNMLDRGATTLWESWDEQDCLSVYSNCHPMFGSVDAWLIRYVLGICVSQDAVGCDHVKIEPHAVCGLTSASGWLDTPRGRIAVSWELRDGEMKVNKSMSGFRVVSYNIRHGEGVDRRVDLSRAAKVISQSQANVVALQEVDVGTERTGGVDQAQDLAEMVGVCATFAKAIDFQGGQYGVAILSQERPLAVRRVPLPGKEPRVLLLAEFEKYVIGTAHLSVSAEAERLQSISIIQREVDAYDKPVILTGDWNALPESSVLKNLGQFLKVVSCVNPEGGTFHGCQGSVSWDVGKCIDYVAVDKKHAGKVFVVGTDVIQEREASDHAPIYVDFGIMSKP